MSKWKEELTILVEAALRSCSLPNPFIANLFQPEPLESLHSAAPPNLLPRAVRICSPEHVTSFKGVPLHPLSKYIAHALCEWEESLVFPRSLECVFGLSEEVQLGDRIKVWAEKVLQVMSTLQEACCLSPKAENTFTVIAGDGNALITEMLADKSLCKDKMAPPAKALHLRPLPRNSQPLDIMKELLQVLNIEGLKALMGFRFTVGSIQDALPPSRSLLLSSFLKVHCVDVVGTTLTVGGRALTKHVHRSSSGWWGDISGNDERKNELALERITYIIENACWLNVHYMPPNSNVFEVRVKEGYGARWTADGLKFRGFLEPQMMDGHEKRWRH